MSSKSCRRRRSHPRVFPSPDRLDQAHPAAPSRPVLIPYREARRAFDRHYWVTALREAGSVTKAAAGAGINRTDLHKRLRLLGIKPINPRHSGKWE